MAANGARQEAQEPTGAQPARQRPAGSGRSVFRAPAFWITAALYVGLTVGTQVFMRSAPVFRAFVEANQAGLLRDYFARWSGYDVVGIVVQTLSTDVFLYQQLLAVALALLLWRRYRAVAAGILGPMLAYAIYFGCYFLFWWATSHHGY